jgi:hypothetical protein
MPPSFPDFSVIEQTIERRLQALKLSPRRATERVDTGYDKFEIQRLKTEVLIIESKDNPANSTDHDVFVASSEILAKLQHPSFGAVEIADLITLDGKSSVDALERCANTYMDVTFPALQALFEGKPGPGAMEMRLSSFTPSLGRPVEWEVFTGQVQILNDNDGWLAARLKETPLALITHTLIGYLAQPQLHWCKLFGKFYAKDNVVLGCSIDGEKSLEAEMLHKFGEVDETPRAWEFRLFVVIRPTDQVDEKSRNAL